jgi:hypothetical protein
MTFWITVFLWTYSRLESAEWIVSHQPEGRELHSAFPVKPEVIWAELDSVATELQETLQVKGTGQPIRVLLFVDQQSYVEQLSEEFPQCRHRKAIFARKGEVSVICAYQSRTLSTDLRHEFTHAILHQHLAFLPLWLDEGLAEMLEEKSSSRVSSSRAAATRWKARLGWRVNFKSLESLPAAEAMNDGDYRDSWAAVYFLMSESAEARGLLAEYISSIHGGKDPGRFSEFSDVRSMELSKRSTAYFRRIPVRAVGASR